MLRSSLIALSHADWAKQTVISFPPARAAAHRFVAGEALEDAMNTIRWLHAKGMSATLDHLGENVVNKNDAEATTTTYLHVIDRLAQEELTGTSISVKLTALGLDLSEQVCIDNVQHILDRAKAHNIKVTIDMEGSDYTEATLRIYRALRSYQGFENVGIVIQSYLYRSEDDMRDLARSGARVRLCKGAYQEPATIAYPDKDDVDDNFAYLTALFLNREAVEAGAYLEVATHDEHMIDAARYHAQRNDIRPDQFEFQMLYGVRTMLQEKLVAEGYQMRIYVPYGTQWYPYFMRRLAERPANLWFFVSNFFRR